MSITWGKGDDGVVNVHISGTLSPSELGDFSASIAPFIETLGKARLLILLDGFQGWETSEDWADISLLESNDEHLEKFAIVGDEQWREPAMMFVLAGLRPVDIRFFTQVEEARNWLLGAAAAQG
jgi:hypothetical protein